MVSDADCGLWLGFCVLRVDLGLVVRFLNREYMEVNRHEKALREEQDSHTSLDEMNQIDRISLKAAQQILIFKSLNNTRSACFNLAINLLSLRAMR